MALVGEGTGILAASCRDRFAPCRSVSAMRAASRSSSSALRGPGPGSGPAWWEGGPSGGYEAPHCNMRQSVLTLLRFASYFCETVDATGREPAPAPAHTSTLPLCPLSFLLPPGVLSVIFRLLNVVDFSILSCLLVSTPGVASTAVVFPV